MRLAKVAVLAVSLLLDASCGDGGGSAPLSSTRPVRLRW